MKKNSILLFLCWLATCASANPMDVTISGESHEKVKLESLSPDPAIPGADALTFSLDGGKSAAESEVVPLSARDAAKETRMSNNTRYGMPAIPTAPFIAQVLPPAEDVESRRKVLRKPMPVATEAPYWEFRVVDENDVAVFEKTGTDFPVPPQSWDGLQDGQFILDPNRTYVSFIVAHSSGISESWPGEAFRFMALLHQEEEKSTITFSSRVYKKERVQFREEAKIYLDDVARLLSLYPSTWTVTLIEPAGSDLAPARLELWRTTLSAILGKKFSTDSFVIEPSKNEESSVQIVMRGVDLKAEPVMHGKISPPIPHLESSAAWIAVRETEEMMLIEMQHDRLFLPGSAFLRDAALPQVTAVLSRVREERDDRKIMLRSYTERPLDKKLDKKVEDPKLAALRTKVLFNLFARERFLP